MGKLSAIWRFFSSWYVSGPLLAVLGIVIGAWVFFNVYPGKPKIGVMIRPLSSALFWNMPAAMTPSRGYSFG